jgi:hypothetical protein
VPAVLDTLEKVGKANVIQIENSHLLKIEGEGEQRHFLYDGVRYENLDEIPNPVVREQAEQALATAAQVTPAGADRPVVGSKIVINGVTYHSLDEIPSPQLRQAVEAAMKKAEQQIGQSI